MYTIQHVERSEKSEKESIHSGHFMVSHFEAEEQDDEDNVAVPIPEVIDSKAIVPAKIFSRGILDFVENKRNQQQLAIDTSLSKLFQCMSLAYRQKLTSPKWNRFRGIRLRWKDKIRLNNVIWRCWHLQFIKKENTLICQFASPLDVDTHNKPEAVVLEGKYWKRKLAAVTAEYKKWRMFYRNHALGHSSKEWTDMLSDSDLLVWDSNSSDNMNMMVDEDYMGLMSDTLFSTITNQPFVFPDSREIAKAGLADFIQPSLGPLQPNLDDYMDTFDPLQEFINSKLPTVPEEQSQDPYKSFGWGYMLENSNNTGASIQATPVSNSTELIQSVQQVQQYQPVQQVPQMPLSKPAVPIQDTRQNVLHTTYTGMLQQPVEHYNIQQPPTYSVISKTNNKPIKSSHQPQSRGRYGKSIDNTTIYQSYPSPNVAGHGLLNDRIQLSLQDASQSTSQSQQTQQIQEVPRFKQPQATYDHRQPYKFTAPSTPNVKFTSQLPQVQQQTQMMQAPFSAHSHYNNSSPHLTAQKDEKPEPRRRGAPRGRGRSRSNTREPIKRPPLLSAVSDPALLTPSNSVLLTHLLTNSAVGAEGNTSLYNQNRGSMGSLGSSHDISNQIRVKEETKSIPILPQPSPATLINVSSQVTINTVQSNTDPLLLNTYSNSNSPILDSSSQNLHSPTSSQGSIGSPNRECAYRDKRVGHIHAEQKRRYNIKNGFDMIHSLIPHLNQNPNAKLSKAAMLQKGAEYIRQLRSERSQLKEEMDSLRQQIETLNTSISNCQSMLPATGAPVSRRRDSKMQEMFDEYVRNRTIDNWKFWIFSLIFRPLLNSFNNFVSTSSLDDLYTSTLLWIEQHCTLVDLRPVVLNSLRYLCTKTDILSDPDKLPDEARQLVEKPSNSLNKNN